MRTSPAHCSPGAKNVAPYSPTQQRRTVRQIVRGIATRGRCGKRLLFFLFSSLSGPKKKMCPKGLRKDKRVVFARTFAAVHMATIAFNTLNIACCFVVLVMFVLRRLSTPTIASFSIAQNVRWRLSGDAGVQAEEPSGGVSWRNRRVSGRRQLRRAGLKCLNGQQ